MSEGKTERRSMAGRTLRTTDDQVLGTVEAVEGPAMLLQLDGARLYVPFTAIHDVDGDTINLAVHRQDVDAQGWERPPSEEMDAVATTTSIAAEDIGAAESPGLAETAPETPFPYARPENERQVRTGNT